ncbi:phosphatidylserine/phosphatidylglycerophosphate/cardiolipin synthase family protein [Burkholderia ambifaria]|uniref:Phosphatidylserine/phosphatidylglycerophosphate/ cardiolipin synthase family protein n=1 Tax=Burkholderia ambifaria TaxID=152480 RepID=A0AA41E991_9BURK|nr:phosphatidylserine/phosphatidylglycerophosphate/cardiolipin synthase family protein [Burkholderia ambifaria]MBR8130744.1 phosphatidylserine/phosphatidylglycerophosphate/cardiolipin synthase family protein [Burkholderia ambifaria]PRD96979.1 hypothetical protein C6P77_23910 [Burkholderia ambifaria]
MTGQLAMTCHVEFVRRGGTVLQSQLAAARAHGVEFDRGLTQRLNQLGAEVVYEALRRHYKDKPKSSNKIYTKQAMEVFSNAGKIERRAEHARWVGIRLYDLELRGAPLEDFVAEGVGNCGVVSAAAVALVRSLGLKANNWYFLEKEDAEDSDGNLLSFPSHGVCIVGEVSALDDPTRTAGKYERAGDVTADHLWIVDVWSGVCCSSKNFADVFKDKMATWHAQGKLIAIEVPAEGGHDGECRERHVSPIDPVWLCMTVDSALGLRKDTEPDSKYRPE